jgi:hypothetical protein
MRIGDQYAPFDAVNLMAKLHTLDVDWTQGHEALQGKALRVAVVRILACYEGDEDE